MAVSPQNRLRWRKILIAREVKAILTGPPARAGMWLGGRIARLLLPWLWRWLFLAPDGKVHRAGEIMLAELRDQAGLNRLDSFDPDPLVMAYREGQRKIVRMILFYLDLDEAEVGKLMEVDDGLGD